MCTLPVVDIAAKEAGEVYLIEVLGRGEERMRD